MIELSKVSKFYGTKQALNNLSLTIEYGKISGFIGYNGAGKSTTIKSLVSIIEPSSGTITFDGQKLSDNRMAIKKKKSAMCQIVQIFFYNYLPMNTGI